MDAREHIRSQVETVCGEFVRDFDISAIVEEIVNLGCSDIDEVDYDEFIDILHAHDEGGQ